MTPHMTYPMHEKLKPLQGHSQAIGEFLEWCQSTKGWVLAERGHDDILSDDVLWPASYQTTDLLAEYFGIDLDVLEDEKRAMLRTIQETADGAS